MQLNIEAACGRYESAYLKGMDIEELKQDVLQCSLPAALEVVGERWSFLILRATFNGFSHFEQFQAQLGIARNILASRLAKLVQHGILQRCDCADDRRKVIYTLTPKGEALLPTLIALRQWGERWEACCPSNPVLVDKRDGRPVRDIKVTGADGRMLELSDLCWKDRAEITQS
jgi:DNA-binding HxlR family transcriptional regulator